MSTTGNEHKEKHHSEEVEELKEEVIGKLESLEEELEQKIAEVEEEILEEIVDLEEHCHEGHRPPRARGYRVRVNGELFVVHKERPTGREIMDIAGITPPEKYGLYLKIHGQQYRRVGLDETIDLRAPGVEKFKTLPLDQTEGSNERAS